MVLFTIIKYMYIEHQHGGVIMVFGNQAKGVLGISEYALLGNIHGFAAPSSYSCSYSIGVHQKIRIKLNHLDITSY